MEEQTDFLSPSHKHLLTVATWAKYLAWVVLFIYVLSAFGYYIQTATYAYNNTSGKANDFIIFLADNKLYAVSFFIQMLGIVLKGTVYFLVLKAVSFALNMIVETDINYREQKGGEQ